MLSWLRHYIGPSPRSKILNTIWILLGGYLLWVMLLRDFNLAFNVFRFSILTYFLVQILRENIGDEIIKRYLRNNWLIGFFSLSLTTSFFFSAFTTKLWNPGNTIPNACFGSVHIHHIDWAAIYAIWLGYIIFVGKSKEELRFQARIAKWVGWFLIGCFGVFSLFYGLFPETNGFWKTILSLAAFTFSLWWVLSNEVASSTSFRLFIAISFGVALGVFLQGFHGLLSDLQATLTIFGDQFTCQQITG